MDGSEIAGCPVDDRCPRSAKGVRAILTSNQTDLCHPLADIGVMRQKQPMGTMLTISVIGLAFGLLAGRLVRAVVQPSRLWPITCLLALVPGIVIGSAMPFVTQMVAWGLLILIPAAAAWLTGCIAGAVLPTVVIRNVR